MKKSVMYKIAIATFVCIMALVGCGTNNSSKSTSKEKVKVIKQKKEPENEEVKTDDYINALAEGLVARWNAVDGVARPFLEEKEVFRGYVEIEMEQLKQFEGKTFEDADLQTLAEKYMVALENQLKACDQETEDEYSTYWIQGDEARELYLNQIQEKYDFISKITDSKNVVEAYCKTNREFTAEPAESITNIDWGGLYSFNDPNLPSYAFYIEPISSASETPFMTIYSTEDYGEDSDPRQGYIMNDNTLIFPFQDVDQSGVKDKTLFLIVYKNDNGEYFLRCLPPKSEMSTDTNAVNLCNAIEDAYTSGYFAPLSRQ